MAKNEDKYLKEFDDAVGKKKWALGMKTYRGERKRVKNILNFWEGGMDADSISKRRERMFYGNTRVPPTDEGRRFDPKDFTDRAYYKARADELAKGDSPENLFNALYLYKRLGMADRPSVRKKIVDFAKKHYNGYPADFQDSGYELKNPGRDVWVALREYLERTSQERPMRDVTPKRSSFEKPSERGLVGKTETMVGIVGIVVSLFFLSPLLTGNIVGGLDLKSSSIVGVIVFAIGLVSLLLSLRHK